MTDPLDQAALDDLIAMVGDDPEFVDEVVDTFLDDAPRQIATIREAVADGSREAAIRPAHTLKGSSASLGGAAVTEISRAIEESARSSTADGLATMVDDLERAYAELVVALEAARARRWKPS